MTRKTITQPDAARAKSDRIDWTVDRTTRYLKTDSPPPVSENLAQEWVEAHSDVTWEEMPFHLRFLLNAAALNLIQWHVNR